MSARLEQHAVYLLPHALEGTEYVLLEAVQEHDGWYLVETHAAPIGNDRFNERATLPAAQMLRYAVTTDGALVAPTSGAMPQDTGFSLANLSLMGYLRDGAYISAAETA
jgi:hypothetical protein